MSRLARRPAGSGGIPPRDEARGATASVRAIGRPRRAVVDAVVAAKRARYPILGAPATLAVLLEVLEREGFDLMLRPCLPRYFGSCMAIGPTAVISLEASLREDEQLIVLAHELGHAWLHNDFESPLERARAEEIRRLGSNGPIYRQFEAEADLVAAQLLGVSPAVIARRFQYMHAQHRASAAA